MKLFYNKGSTTRFYVKHVLVGIDYRAREKLKGNSRTNIQK